MNKSLNKYLSKSRKAHHLKLSDLAFLLEVDSGNLSRFEAGKLSNPKALLAYQQLFNLSMDCSIRQVFETDYNNMIDRCHQLFEVIDTKAKTNRNRLRIEGLGTILIRLTELQEEYDKQ